MSFLSPHIQSFKSRQLTLKTHREAGHFLPLHLTSPISHLDTAILSQLVSLPTHALIQPLLLEADQVYQITSHPSWKPLASHNPQTRIQTSYHGQ